MNRKQMAIVASWAILTVVAICVISKVTQYAPYGLLLFLFVRERFVDDKVLIKQYFSDRRKRTIALMVFSIAPFAWYLYRLLSAPRLPLDFGMEVIFSSIPLLAIMAIYDRWLYNRTSECVLPHRVIEP